MLPLLLILGWNTFVLKATCISRQRIIFRGSLYNKHTISNWILTYQIIYINLAIALLYQRKTIPVFIMPAFCNYNNKCLAIELETSKFEALLGHCEFVTYLWWLKRIIRREMDRDQKYTSSIRAISRPHYRCLPMEHIFRNRTYILINWGSDIDLEHNGSWAYITQHGKVWTRLIEKAKTIH